MANNKKRNGYSHADKTLILEAVRKYPDNRAKGIKEIAGQLKRTPAAINAFYYGRLAKQQQQAAKKSSHKTTSIAKEVVKLNGATHNGAISRIDFGKIIVDAMHVEEKKELLRYIIS